MAVKMGFARLKNGGDDEVGRRQERSGPEGIAFDQKMQGIKQSSHFRRIASLTMPVRSGTPTSRSLGRKAHRYGNVR